MMEQQEIQKQTARTIAFAHFVALSGDDSFKSAYCGEFDRWQPDERLGWYKTLYRSYSGIGHDQYFFLNPDPRALRERFQHARFDTILLDGILRGIRVEDWRY